MRGFLLLLMLVVLFFWGGPMVAVAFFSAPIGFVIAVLILAAWKVVDSFKVKAR